jgi:hypothetical protein
LMSKRETTQPCVKVPKYQLSVIDKECLLPKTTRRLA